MDLTRIEHIVPLIGVSVTCHNEGSELIRLLTHRSLENTMPLDHLILLAT
jgi:hypothetical protein